MATLKHLFQPIKIGSLNIANRIVMSAMDPGFGITDDGCLTDQHIAFVEERARSRPGMIICGATPVHPTGTADPFTMKNVYLWDDRSLPSLEKFVKAVHQHDVPFGAQLTHFGLSHTPSDSIAASEIAKYTARGVKTRGATKEEIQEFVQAFASGAERCRQVGFDFVEIHGGHGYILNNFLTPMYNLRTDEYGGTFENRIRFLMEIIRAIQSRLGPSFPIGVRLNGDDFIGEGGWNMTDVCRLAPILEKEGVAYISLTAGATSYGTVRYTILPMYAQQGEFVRFAEEAKKHVSIPVIAVGRIKDPVVADRIIAEGRADLTIMSRAQVADPEMVAKARRGDLADIRYCIADCLGCIESIMRHGEASCAVNARVGREYLIQDVEGDKAACPKKVLVVGAGVAGLEAARRAAFSGHKVLVCESRGWVGGQLRYAASIPKREEIADILPWLERQLNRLGVEVRLNKQVDESFLDEMKPDALIIATGSLPEVPLGFIRGLENVKDLDILLVDEFLEEKKLLGRNVMVLGGEQIGMQVADYISENGHQVCIVENSDHFATKMASSDRHFLIDRLAEKNVKRFKSVERVEIEPWDRVWLVDSTGRHEMEDIHSLILASHRRPNTFLVELAERKGIPYHLVGDAMGLDGEIQGTIMGAVASGYDAGRQV